MGYNNIIIQTGYLSVITQTLGSYYNIIIQILADYLSIITQILEGYYNHNTISRLSQCNNTETGGLLQ